MPQNRLPKLYITVFQNRLDIDLHMNTALPNLAGNYSAQFLKITKFIFMRISSIQKKKITYEVQNLVQLRTIPCAHLL